MGLIAEAITDSEVRSIARYLVGLFGTPPSSAPILTTRAQEKLLEGRPFWRIDSPVTGQFGAGATGWIDGDRTYGIGYYGLDWSDRNEKVARLMFAMSNERTIPFYAYDAAWWPPTVYATPDVDGLEAGDYTVACTVTNYLDEESLASESRPVTLAAPSRLRVYVPSWPHQNPLSKKVSVYLNGTLAGTADQVERGWTPVDIAALPDPVGPTPPDQSTLRYGHLRVSSVSATQYESLDVDGEFDGIVTARCTRELPTTDFLTEPLWPFEGMTVTLDDGYVIVGNP